MNIKEAKLFDIYGTARIFEKRALKYKNYLNLINYSALGIPLIVGAIFLNYGNVHAPIKLLALLLMLIQILIFLWSIIVNWNEDYNYSVMTLKRQNELFSELNALDEKSADYNHDLKNLLEREKRYSTEDISKTISEKEKRFATRQSLYYFKYECNHCDKIPKTLKPWKEEKCDNCTNY